ncbi:HK97 family phage prohead protease [Pasteurella multocida]|uniref:HK97 family phage prohead protease n=1 Tax=Pasteurella multocida TaxID=747 RepID=UPI0007EDFF35|nr:HK97 family phage prohead protease [Pasteurella multocida]MCL7798120.1 HK97 family phage prohead protease [Pasteurella multocida]MCL7822118.1 HK97 family phage prohead protease [Pasteurella multocida]MDG2542073.1 HK97 family phage prohead protease [Pasteurella multocida]MEB3466279.1 HK97 family phage prohead protease [Pasteurella multocida]OBP34070.1 peptidase [Pasteurella multocida subsp. multocida]
MNKDFEIRSSELSAENEKLIGYVVKWNSPSELMWGEFVEQFAQGAFSETLSSGADVRALFEHDHTKLLGRTQANTLKLEEDSIGLRFELTPPETSLGKDLLVSVKRGDITGMSFGFRAKAENWNFDLTPCQRIVTNAELVEITVTSIPAYPESNVQIAQRSMAQAKARLQPKTTALLDRWTELAEL